MKTGYYWSFAALSVMALISGFVAPSRPPAPSEEPVMDSAEDAELLERESRSRERVNLKLRLLYSLIDGKCTLDASAEALLELIDPKYNEALQNNYPAETAKQSLALQLIESIRIMPLDPARQAEVLARLDKEFEQMKGAPRPVSSSGAPYGLIPHS